MLNKKLNIIFVRNKGNITNLKQFYNEKSINIGKQGNLYDFLKKIIQN